MTAPSVALSLHRCLSLLPGRSVCAEQTYFPPWLPIPNIQKP